MPILPSKCRFLFVFLSLSSASCVESANPISDPDNSAADGNLYGVWIHNRNGHTSVRVIGQASEAGNAQRIPLGIMRSAESSLSGTNQVAPARNEIFFVSSVGQERFLNSFFADLSQPWNKAAITRYYLCKYQVIQNRLIIWQGDRDAVARAIENGLLRGTVTRSDDRRSITSAQLTDTSANIAKYLQMGGAAVFFPDKMKTEYVRIAATR